jgi:hypothetical protein
MTPEFSLSLSRGEPAEFLLKRRDIILVAIFLLAADAVAVIVLS